MNILKHIGRYIIFIKNVFHRPEKFRMYWNETMRQMNDIGIGSLSIVALSSVFIGAVTAVQFAYQLADSIAPTWWVGFVVRDSMILELAPTITCLLLSGKVGSNISSELGNMRITEQIDALEIMGVKTSSYLVAPKLIAGLTVIPLLTIISAFLGIFGGGAAGTLAGYFTPAEYQQGVLDEFDPFAIQIMLVKSVTFAFIFTSIACYQGYYVKGGAIELGHASTRAVVYSILLILASDYIIAALML